MEKPNFESLSEFTERKFYESVEEYKQQILDGLDYINKLREKGYKFTPEQEEIWEKLKEIVEKRLNEIKKK